MSRSFCYPVVCALALSLPSIAFAGPDITVLTDKGAVTGRQDRARTFLGIPYAAPPTGPLRWKAPQPVEAWSEPRAADTIGNVCPQVVLAIFPLPGKAAGDVEGKEDCLYLNVFAPNSAVAGGGLPVMVWIHGGSFTIGSGSAYDGSVLAEKYGLVVVTLNYRLGALGFLAADALESEAGNGSGYDSRNDSGNYGLLDQQAALRWVKSNIGAFGGDPANVTVAGESAGGMSVCAQLASPLAAGLFQKAIIQSGLCASPGNTVTVQEAVKRNAKFVKKLGCAAADLTCLRNVAAGILLKTTVPGRRPVSNLVWSPVYGTSVLPLSLKAAFESGKFNRVPVLAGTNHDEGRLFISAAPRPANP